MYKLVQKFTHLLINRCFIAKRMLPNLILTYINFKTTRFALKSWSYIIIVDIYILFVIFFDNDFHTKGIPMGK